MLSGRRREIMPAISGYTGSIERRGQCREQFSSLARSRVDHRAAVIFLRGDAPNKAVREEADLAVKAVFSSRAEVEVESETLEHSFCQLPRHICQGSNASLNAYGFSTAQGKKMQGFGSEPSDDISSRTGV